MACSQSSSSLFRGRLSGVATSPCSLQLRLDIVHPPDIQLDPNQHLPMTRFDNPTTSLTGAHITITRLGDGSFAYLAFRPTIGVAGSTEEVADCKKKCGHEICTTLTDHFQEVHEAGPGAILTDEAAILTARMHSYSGLKARVAKYCARLHTDDVTAGVSTPYTPEA